MKINGIEMGNKKFIITALTLVVLTIGFNIAIAEGTNSLTQVDVKKSQTADTIDVTFYTTDVNTNTVVTKKPNNKYVVLLPNVSGSSAATPSIGGLKDILSNVEIKNVNDGMGGYTKITFDATKPITIKTYNKKSNPLTPAQTASQTVIAKNTTKPAAPQTQKTTTTPVKPASTAQTKPSGNNTQPAVSKTVSTPKLVPIEIPKINILKNDKNTTKSTPQPKIQVKETPKVVNQPTQPRVSEPVQNQQTPLSNDYLNSDYQPKMKFDENGKRIVDLEPRVSHTVNSEDSDVAQNEVSEDVSSPIQPAPNALKTDTQKKHKFPWLVTLGGLILLGGGVLYLVFDAIRHSNQKDASRLESFFSLSTQNQAKRRRREYYDIVNDDTLSWQEKYKRYVEKEQQNSPKKHNDTPSFVTNIGANKTAFVMPNIEEKQTSNDKLAQTIQRPEKSHNDIIREKLQQKISQMEHSLAQTPSTNEPKEYSNEVVSEDNAIMNKISNIKLKSFAKPKTLKQTQRHLTNDDRITTTSNEYQEGQFVKLSDTPLSVSRRKSESTKITSPDIIGTASKYLTNNGETNMNKENENYLVSSLDEYMSILDAEEERKSKTSLTDVLSKVKHEHASTASHMGVTNPISKSDNKPLLGISGGLVVKSGYNIDADRGIYLVNIDGVSALIGKVKDNTYMLKKFDKVIDKQLQVRQDDDHVYIVRAGSYKCLVDVTTDKMGTLIEI